MEKSMQFEYNPRFEGRCEAAAKAGFDGVDIDFYPMLGKTQSDWDAVIEDIQRILAKTGLKCFQTHPYFYSLLDGDDEVSDEVEFSIHKAIIAGAKLGAKWNVIHPRSAISSGFRTTPAMESNLKMIGGYIETAQKHGTGIVVENMPIFKNRQACKPYFSWNYEDLCNLVDKLGDAGICWDTGHAQLMFYDQGDAIRYIGGRLKTLHIQNNVAYDDEHIPVSCGHVDWKGITKAFVDIGYSGALNVEVGIFYDDVKLIESYIRHNYDCLEYLERLMEDARNEKN